MGAYAKTLTDTDEVAGLVDAVAADLEAGGRWSIREEMLSMHFGLSCEPYRCGDKHKVQDRCPDDWSSMATVVRRQARGFAEAGLCAAGMNKTQSRRCATAVVQALEERLRSQQ